MSTHTTRRRPSRVRTTGGALAATGAVAAIAQLAVGGGVAHAEEAVPTNGSLLGENNTDTADGQVTAPVEVADNSEPVVSENSETPTNGSLVDGPPGVAEKPTTKAPAPEPAEPSAEPSSDGTPVANTGSDNADAPEPVFTAPGAADGEAPGGAAVTPAPEPAFTAPEAPVAQDPVVTASAPAPAPKHASTQVSNDVSLNGSTGVKVATTYTGGQNFAASDSDLTAPGIPGKVNVTSTYDNGVRSASVEVAGAPIDMSGTATPVDNGQYPGPGGVYDTQGTANIGNTSISYDGTINGDNNATSGNFTVDLPGNAPDITVPVSTPSVPVDVSHIPSPQQIMSGVQGLLGGR